MQVEAFLLFPENADSCNALLFQPQGPVLTERASGTPYLWLCFHTSSCWWCRWPLWSSERSYTRPADTAPASPALPVHPFPWMSPALTRWAYLCSRSVLGPCSLQTPGDSSPVWKLLSLGVRECSRWGNPTGTNIPEYFFPQKEGINLELILK